MLPQKAQKLAENMNNLQWPSVLIQLTPMGEEQMTEYL